ncbi:MAG: hypothetical protein R3B36_33210 [Polyangiaceae bacterium]
MTEQYEMFDVLDLAEKDEGLPACVRDVMRSLRVADAAYNTWCVAVKRGERRCSKDLDETLVPILDRDDEVVLAWKAYCASRNDESTAALVDALRAATEERLRITRDL